jgi:ketosteroid isomerase-like protein
MAFPSSSFSFVSLGRCLGFRFNAGFRVVILALLLLSVFSSYTTPSFAFFGKGAKAATSSKENVTLKKTPETKAPTFAADEANIRKALASLLAASNRHDLKAMLEFYSSHFTSGDRMGLKSIKELVEETWRLYPDIHYETTLLEVRLNGDWATVESLDRSNATVGNAPNLPKEKGQLLSESRTQMFWHRVGSSWLIESDATLYEKASIRFGTTQGLELKLEAPDQVFSGEGYTAKVAVNLPSNAYAIASITREPLVYPHLNLKERYRTLGEERTTLERVFEANSTNHNELVTATIGLIEVGRDEEQRPVVRMKGVATLVKRINVLPQMSDSSALGLTPSSVKTSASGLIDTSKVTDPADENPAEAGMLPTTQSAKQEEKKK